MIKIDEFIEISHMLLELNENQEMNKEYFGYSASFIISIAKKEKLV